MSCTYKVLLVDDDPRVLEMLADIFSEQYSTLLAASGAESVDLVNAHDDIGVVVMDIKMAGMDGITAARNIRQIRPDTPIIFHTGYPGDYEESHIDENEKPFDYIEKGNSIGRLKRSVGNALASYSVGRDVRQLQQHAEAAHGIIGRSPAMMEIFRLIQRVGASNAKVMILGETGTGKELVARAIHDQSSRSGKRIAIFNCNHKSPDLVQSELFGHIKGAFTDAIADRVGIFEYADQGTLFLDEIGDLDFQTQAKLLRAVETGEYSRLGESEVHISKIRVICATNRDLEAMTSSGHFREDLYYRLKGIQIRLPALRDRREDIPLLVERFIDRFTIEQDLPPKFVDPEALRLLVAYDWPGNVRQLLDTVETLLVLTESDIIMVDDVQKCLRLGACDPFARPKSLTAQMKEYRRKLIIEALCATENNVAEAARMLEVDKSNLRKWCLELKIPLR
ncbi:MAG TPA: sigma-54 dependent transcriptional regulator [Candidatus Acidoferrum sp.]|nr:sigma-54 dependent transcriptional regulator [Candidatus Acidoferrum sp.]